jgi:hypothetical protein
MLDHVEQNDRIHCPKPPEFFFIRGTIQNVQSRAATISCGIFDKLDANNIEEICPRFLQKEAIGTADLKQSTSGTMLA